MRRTILAASPLSLAVPAFAQISDKVAEDAYIYAYSIDEAYKFFYETAVKTDATNSRRSKKSTSNRDDCPGIDQSNGQSGLNPDFD